MTNTTRNSKHPQGPQSRRLAQMLREATPEQIRQASEIAAKLLTRKAMREPRPKG